MLLVLSWLIPLRNLARTISPRPWGLLLRLGSWKAQASLIMTVVLGTPTGLRLGSLMFRLSA